ncbi:hypothetical protein QWY85_12315 [Neolewinella lacunae]|uniref:Cas10/Cmr2 second palm domain-containing protein n=1 Tax=Neolewinella lacunae TaxID=1517758 RepID=A0A923PJF5_9BACT|nr:hypothetical protein [Neolewinella lacunae]MBC6995243.1 hypothetical protein [Neolewinella lacunae]MDN3635448.1 hypothetical protein [Neolewinella lacunae]
MTQYLYGAKVQGIQSYIFETNKLKDIGGASELIESLAGERFAGFFSQVGVSYKEEQLLRNAAGEISYLFHDKASCAAVVRGFERFISTEIPGLTVSQAVVPLEGTTLNLSDASHEVNRLLQVQRNRATPPSELGWMISERARRTGRPGVKQVKKDGLIDRRQQSKREVADHRRLHDKLIGDTHPFEKEDFAFELEDIVNKREGAWLAVVHADGNNLGKLIQKLLPELPADQLEKGYRQFSIKLEEATVAAARIAYQKLLDCLKAEERNAVIAGEMKLPIRPVIIGGDDLTVILRAEHAVAFTKAYLEAFEQETQEKFGNYAKEFGVAEHFKDGLTACAGIAIIKPKFPFHYAAHLAEELCSWTKNVAKKIDEHHTPSSLHFHKVQASFVENYKDIIERELTTVKDDAVDEKLLTAGPYFVNDSQEGYPTVKQLLRYTEVLGYKDTPAGPLRDYLGELRVDAQAAAQKLERIRDLNKDVNKELDLSEETLFQKRGSNEKASTHLYDAIQLANLL